MLIDGDLRSEGEAEESVGRSSRTEWKHHPLRIAEPLGTGTQGPPAPQRLLANEVRLVPPVSRLQAGVGAARQAQLLRAGMDEVGIDEVPRVGGERGGMDFIGGGRAKPCFNGGTA